MERLLKKEGVIPKEISDAEAHRHIYRELRRCSELILISDVLHPGYYNNSPQTLGVYQLFRVQEGWIRFIYHGSLMLYIGDRQRYFSEWANSLNHGIRFLRNSKDNRVISNDELIKFHKNTQRHLRSIEDGDLGNRTIVGMYPQGELLTIIDQQNRFLRLQVFPAYTDVKKLRRKITDYTRDQIKQWVKQNEEHFGFHVSLIHEEDIYDVVANPKNLKTIRTELKKLRQTAKPGTIPFGI
ncbi:MAG: hypothetical protein AABY22_24190 [Nanoarchaeota archaeon]